MTYGTVAASLLTHSLRAHHRVGLTHRGLFTRGEFASRWLSSQFTFTAPGEACVGIYLLYNLRHIERVRGTTRHVTHLLIASIVSLGLQTMLCNCDAPLARWLGLTGSASSLLFIKNFQSVGFAPGPHSVIASLLIPGFTKLVPTTHTFTTGLGMRFGDKMFTHLAAAQLFASHGAASVIPACCGVVGSAVAEWIAGGPRGWTPPRWVCDVVEGTFGRVLRGGGGIAPRATVRRANARPGGGGGGRWAIVEQNDLWSRRRRRRRRRVRWRRSCRWDSTSTRRGARWGCAGTTWRLPRTSCWPGAIDDERFSVLVVLLTKG